LLQFESLGSTLPINADLDTNVGSCLLRRAKNGFVVNDICFSGMDRADKQSELADVGMPDKISVVPEYLFRVPLESERESIQRSRVVEIWDSKSALVNVTAFSLTPLEFNYVK